MALEILAEFRKFAVTAFGGGRRVPRLTQLESLAVAQVDPSGAELTRAGRRFLLGNSAAITGIANATALPTTAAQWVIWNAENEETLFLDELGMYLTSGTPGAGGVLLACHFTTPSQDAVSATAGTYIMPAHGGARLPRVIVKSSVTITQPTAPTWYPITENTSPNVGAFPGSGCFARRDILGRIAIPPKTGLGLAVIGLAGTSPLWAPFAMWSQWKADME